MLGVEWQWGQGGGDGGPEMDLSWEEARGLAPLQGAAGASPCCLGLQSPQLVSEENKTEASLRRATPPWPNMGCG